MFKFFRRIRQKLLAENKFSKYLIYAFGEIVLVVIGILIALQINNWNENRADTKRFISELKELKSELLTFDEQLEIRVKSLEAIEAYGLYLQDFANDKLTEIDTIRLRKALYYTGYLLVIEKSNSAYLNLVNSGDLKFIRSKDLKKDLSIFYNKSGWRSSFHDNVIIKSYEEYLRYIHQFTAPGSMRTLYNAEQQNIRNDITLKGEAIDALNIPFGTMVDWDKLRSDIHFKTLIDNVLTNRFLQINQYNIENRDDIIRIISLIDKELENL